MLPSTKNIIIFILYYWEIQHILNALSCDNIYNGRKVSSVMVVKIDIAFYKHLLPANRKKSVQEGQMTWSNITADSLDCPFLIDSSVFCNLYCIYNIISQIPVSCHETYLKFCWESELFEWTLRLADDIWRYK